MNNLCLYLLFTIVPAICSFGQQNPPLILKGRITNSPEKILFCYYKNEHSEQLTDTLLLDDEGNFYLETYTISSPAVCHIRNNKTQLNDLLVAPGFELTIMAQGPDFKDIFLSKEITGKGAGINQYQLLLERRLSGLAEKAYYEMSEKEFTEYCKKVEHLQDSLYESVFNFNNQADSTILYFSKMKATDNQSRLADMCFSYIQFNRYNHTKATALLQQNCSWLDRRYLNQKQNLSSPIYRYLVSSAYLNHLLQGYYENDKALKGNKKFVLATISEFYTDPAVRSYVLERMFDSYIYNAKNYADLQKALALRDTFSVFMTIQSLADLDKKEVEKTRYLERTLSGALAADFVLEDPSGKKHSWREFEGKVVYLDLWASWCGPCREETPHLQKIVEKYKDDDRLAVVAIAVSDAYRDWQKAIEKDQPSWPQLIDNENFIKDFYMADLIPKFVLIDKKGKIISVDAPRPSQYAQLINLLEEELNK